MEQQYFKENLLNDKFSVNQVNYLRCSDIVELHYRHGILYLCGVIDTAIRRPAGWSSAKNQIQNLVQNAFRMAVGRNVNRTAGFIYHSDRDCQHTVKRTKQLVKQYGFHKSMYRPDTSSDNQQSRVLCIP